jgi:hypothetical protein
LIRANFTEADYHVLVRTVAKNVPLTEYRFAVSAIIDAGRDWMSEETLDEFVSDLPPVFPHLIHTYYLPDYYNYVTPMRDAPTLASKPKLRRVGCYGIPICFPCII